MIELEVEASLKVVGNGLTFCFDALASAWQIKHIGEPGQELVPWQLMQAWMIRKHRSDRVVGRPLVVVHATKRRAWRCVFEG